MFQIDERNKIKLTIGDTASFTLTIVDNEGNVREPKEGDVLTFSIDDLDFEKVANENVFVIGGSDTLGLEPGVYNYRIVLTTEGQNFTIFQDEFIELLGDGQQEVVDEP